MRAAGLLLLMLAGHIATAQVEHVPLDHPVYPFLDRLGVRGILPLHSSTMLPLERGVTCDLLDSALAAPGRLTATEHRLAEKYRREFDRRAGSRADEDFVLVGSHADAGSFAGGLVSGRSKYLYAYADSVATFRVDLLASGEYRAMHGDSRGTTDLTLKKIGGRFSGTIANRLGFFLQSTNGVMSGNRDFALSDPRLASNVKLNELRTANFDATEAYLRLSFDWAAVEFGREFMAVGTGYGDRLLLSDNGPAFDLFAISARYRSFRFLFVHGAILPATRGFQGLDPASVESPSKYLALHRFQFSLWDALTVGLSEMVIYQRHTPEYAYLNPVNFYKSSEHQLRDRDNALLALDLEYFLRDGWKAYGTLLIDDVDFSRLGTGTWGNQFGWQGGVYAAAVAGIPDLDLIVEYTRIEPYVYSNRVQGNDYSHSNIILGHHLPPNADEIMVEGRWFASADLRVQARVSYQRHGGNVMEGDSLVRNVGGSGLQGHRQQDALTARFLDGVQEGTAAARLVVTYEPIRDLTLVGTAALHAVRESLTAQRRQDVFVSIGLFLDY